MTAFRTLDRLDVKGKRILMRVDLNVPVENGVVTDATRIERVAPAITEIADKGGKVILLSHFGRPKGRDPKQSLKPVAAEVARIIKRPVKFADDCIGEPAEQAVAAMKPGEILCLENTRFHAGEEKNDPAFVGALAKLGDIWVNDAFSAAHRAHASTEGLGHKLPAYAGRTMQAELEALAKALENPTAPTGRDRRRCKDFEQARSARQSAREGERADHWRCNGEYVPPRARKGCREIAGRT